MAMLGYVWQRFLYMIVLSLVLSVVVFAIIQLPPGDYLTTYITRLMIEGRGEEDQAIIDSLRKQYGLDLPIHMQYLKWVWGLVRGDLGRSFFWDRPIKDLLGERLPLTIMISTSTLIFTYIIAIPIGVYSATHQYSIFDYVFTVIGFLGVGAPNFLLALILMFLLYELFGFSVGGIFSPEFRAAVWSWAKVMDMLKHLVVPLVIIGTSGTCGLIRVMRANLLDELRKPYVTTARAKGLTERKLLTKYPMRVAINPILSTIGWALPGIFSGSAIVSMVLLLPTVGPLLLEALRSQDFYVAGSILMILTLLTMIGTFISDILLAWADPRVRFG